MEARTSILCKQLAVTIDARRNCAERMARLNPNAVTADVSMAENEYHRIEEWFHRHEDTILQLVNDFMPSGSGWDCGTKIDLDASHADKIVFYGSYHHMNDGGFYDGWTAHTITVTPSLTFGYHIRVSGRDRNQIKKYLHETFSYALKTLIVWDDATQRWKDVRYSGK